MPAEARLGFLIAGVQKAGTSALHAYLGEVRDLQLPAVKEAHFFDDEEGVDWSAPDPARLHALFADDGRLRGEATPITLYWPNALERAHDYNPAIRLVLLFRDPVERAFSHWRMEWSRRTETLDFATAIREGRARMAGAAPYPGFHRVFSYVERGFYGRQLARARALFPREQILCLPHWLLDRQPDEAVRRVCAFLGVAPPAAPLAPRRVRVAPDVAYPSSLTPADVAHLHDAFAAETRRFHDLAGAEDWRFGPGPGG
ncbi:sulfotransferase domain-containing protein [Sphingomonas sp.]|uniref:sulfotransferase domain-containing protein n=1 Tax=Sphingomonas sp. TaxID=28214 RepID=UPI003B00207A